MRSIFLDRQDSGHISQVDIRFILEEISQKIKVLFLCFFIRFVFSENAVPLVYDDHKRASCLLIDILHTFSKIFFLKIFNVRIFLL